MFDSVVEMMICIACSDLATPDQQDEAWRHALNLGGPAAALEIIGRSWGLR